METILLPTSHPNVIERALEVLQSGGLIAFPTDTVYGVAAPVFNSESIERLYAVKGRENTKAIAVLLGEVEQLKLLTPGLTRAALQLAERFWPGALTLVVPSSPKLPANLSPIPTVGVRMPDHAFARELMKYSGPLATTSANISGGANALTAEEVNSQLGGRIELLLDGGRVPGGMPSTVVDCTGPEIKVLREGPISLAQLLSAIQ